VWRVSKAGGTRGGSRAISGSVTKAERPAGGGSMPRLRERGSARGGFCRSIRVASAFSPRRSTGHPSFYGLLLSQRERQGDWFRARSPTSAYPSVAAVRPCRTDVLPRERGVETPIFASPVAEAVVGRERGSDRGAPGSRAHQDLPPPQRVANSRGTRGRAASRTFGRCNATRPTRTYGGVSYGARRSFAHVPLASPQASPRSGVLLDKGGSPGGRTYTPSFRRERGEPPTFHEVSSTTARAVLVGVVVALPDHSQRPLAERNRVAWPPVGNCARQGGRVSSCAVDRLESEKGILPPSVSSYPPGAGRHARE
jgi:hypothetical protein